MYSLRNKTRGGFIVFLFLSGALKASASPLLNSADVYEAKSWSLGAYGSTNESKPRVDVEANTSIQIPVSGGGSTTIFSKSDAEIQMTQTHNDAILVFTGRPNDGLHYSVKVGQVRDYKLEFSSGSETNSLSAQRDGFLWGIGARWNLTQSTLVSAAFAIDFSYTQLRAKTDRFQGGGTVTSSNIEAQQDEMQVALNASKRWKQIEPFGGLKVTRWATQLKDFGTHERIRGVFTGVSPFVGLKWNFFEGESLVVEASFVDEKTVSAGLNLKF